MNVPVQILRFSVNIFQSDSHTMFEQLQSTRRALFLLFWILATPVPIHYHYNENNQHHILKENHKFLEQHEKNIICIEVS